MSLRTSLVVSALTLSVVAGSAQAATIATFADPTSGPTPSLFQWNGITGTLTGGWSGTGLNLLTPSTSAIDFTNATFTFQPLVAINTMFGNSLFGAGVINFFDSNAVPIFKIEFDNAVLSNSLSLGANDFMAFNVRFSGTLLDSPVTDEAFAFSFANPTPSPVTQGYTVTSSFTSSATIPSPAGLSLMGAGLFVLVRRRRA